MNRADHIYNRKVAREYSERTFPRKAKIMVGASILIGLLIAIALFIGTVRATEELVRQFNP